MAVDELQESAASRPAERPAGKQNDAGAPQNPTFRICAGYIGSGWRRCILVVLPDLRINR